MNILLPIGLLIATIGIFGSKSSAKNKKDENNLQDGKNHATLESEGEIKPDE